MKNVLRPLALAAFAALSLTACKKDAANETVQAEDPAFAQIRGMGFSSTGAQKIDGGYVVEGDIFIPTADLGTQASTPHMLVANEEHYRTYNLVNTSTYPTVKVALNNSSSAHQAVFSAALNEAIARYNALNLRLKFQRVTSGANTSVVAYYQQSNTLGFAGFPSGGAPYDEVQMNTYHYSTSTSSTNVNYIATIIAHELGHCVGFRHTDYMNRAYSCGTGGNEGASTVGAVHIPGTPTGPSANSWMLACSNGGNRPFTSNDRVALNYVY